ncbi:fibrous sheath cabyr-binding protein-like [Plakobranchus ocellatus]|uniref:Fibrous sheath cabyr-binding protein-like n=1 Tax=Plakobranchus ocellatus TaxID=259542 RepID=A0AAV4DJK3_9GAST|nr:fibrous sheath cabyr-binding protein-like [Plakobranchus ocellatus]
MDWDLRPVIVLIIRVKCGEKHPLKCMLKGRVSCGDQGEQVRMATGLLLGQGLGKRYEEATQWPQRDRLQESSTFQDFSQYEKSGKEEDKIVNRILLIEF